MDFYFYDCELKADIGEFSAGKHISSVSMMYSLSKMEFYGEDGEVIGSFDLKLSVS